MHYLDGTRQIKITYTEDDKKSEKLLLVDIAMQIGKMILTHEKARLTLCC